MGEWMWCQKPQLMFDNGAISQIENAQWRAVGQNFEGNQVKELEIYCPAIKILDEYFTLSESMDSYS